MLHIQILLYKSARFIDDLILGLSLVERSNPIIVHFLENSQEDSLKLIEKHKKIINFEFTHDVSQENLGFGKGHNTLFKKYSKEYDDYFMLLNHDTIPFFDFLKNFKDFEKQRDNDWGIIEFTQFPHEHPKDYNVTTFETEWASAAAVIYKTKVFNDVSGFDETFFMYCEDVDISWRIRGSGYKIYHSPFSKIAHMTRELDRKKDPSLEEIHSKAGNLFLRYKFFGRGEVSKYKKLMKDNPYYKKIMNVYDDMLERAKKDKVNNYRSYKHPRIYEDTNYAYHRW